MPEGREYHEYYMNRALALAKQGWGRTNPNPLVGAVLVRDGRIVGEGFHDHCGGAHAEVEALAKAGENACGATLYVNLEPCSHEGRTPPCTRAVIAAGIRKVVVAMIDPNPKVSGRGIAELREAGIEVLEGILEKEAAKLNAIFIKYITCDVPYIILKGAMTLDGKLATVTGDSRWISGEASRKRVHEWRNRVSAVMTGIGTVLADDPSMTTRLKETNCRNPVRIIADSTGRIPLDAKILKRQDDTRIILATTSALGEKKEAALKARGVDIIRSDGEDGRVDLPGLLRELHRRELDSILLEGGEALNTSILMAGLVDRMILFIAPKIVGGKTAPTLTGGAGIPRMKDAIMLSDVEVSACGDDILVEGFPEVKRCLPD